MNVLINKQYKTYTRLSRYQEFPIYYHTLDEKYVTGITDQLNNSTTYNYHLVENGDTYDSISLKYYNNPTYFWIILDFNRIQDPFINPTVGTRLKIPVISTITYEK